MNWKKEIPLLNQIIYLDSASLCLKPLSVIQEGVNFYQNYSISTRTSETPLGMQVKEKIHQTRKKIADLIDASPEEIIFTSGTTASLNQFALMAQQFLKKDDEIILNEHNHTSNIAPWILLCQKIGCKIIISKNIIDDITNKTKIIALSQMSNNNKHNLDINAIFKLIQNKAIVLVNDAAQAIVHQKVSFNNCDVIAFSGNKMYGPTGTGVLAIKKELLLFLSPVLPGGGSINLIENNFKIHYKKGIQKFESGTMNFAGIFQLNVAIDFLRKVNQDSNNHQKVVELSKYLIQQLKTLPQFIIKNQIANPIILFRHKIIPSQDIASYLGSQNIYVRSGDFCAKINSNIICENGFLRVSLMPYNTKENIDILILALKKEEDYFEFL